MEREIISCPICRDLLHVPVTIPCGHNYCMNCITTNWDTERKRISCPQCRKTFRQRPALMKNTMLADLVEELKRSGLQAAPADHYYAGPGDVACDVCTGRKLKALKSCLVCLASYCEKHLRPHYESPPFKKHKLVDPAKNLLENIYSRHNDMMEKLFRTDEQFMYHICFLDQHKDQHIVSAEIEQYRHEIQQRLQDRERDLEGFEEEAINGSLRKILTRLCCCCLKKRRSDVKQAADRIQARGWS